MHFKAWSCSCWSTWTHNYTPCISVESEQASEAKYSFKKTALTIAETWHQWVSLCLPTAWLLRILLWKRKNERGAFHDDWKLRNVDGRRRWRGVQLWAIGNPHDGCEGQSAIYNEVNIQKQWLATYPGGEFHASLQHIFFSCNLPPRGRFVKVLRTGLCFVSTL